MKTTDLYRIESLFKAKQLALWTSITNLIAWTALLYFKNYSLGTLERVVISGLILINITLIALTVRRWSINEVL